MTFFPPIGILNRYHIGDTVLLEPIAESLSTMLGSDVYIQSGYKELLKHHPNVTGMALDDKVPEDMRLLDLSDALDRMPGKRLGKMDASKDTGKLLKIYEAAGVAFDPQVRPTLFLSHSEQMQVSEIKSLFGGFNVGIGISSRFGVKNWPYMRQLISNLSKSSYNVFVFAEGIGFWEKRILKNQKVYKVVDKPLRESMVWMAAMDICAGPDTGLMHIAGALSVPMVVMVWQNFSDLYEHYENCTILSAKKYGLGAISVQKVIKAIHKHAHAKEESQEANVLFVRCRGIGDILMTLPALATLKAHDGSSKYTYATSQAGAQLLRGTRLVDKTVVLDYDHATSGLPRLPKSLDISSYSAVHNLINRVDFAEQAANIPRTDMFGEMLDVKEVDYSLDWKIKPLYSWQRNAELKMEKAGLPTKAPFIAIQYTAAGWSREWPKQRVLKFITLAMAAGHRIAVMSEARDEAFPEGVINVTGQLSFEEYVGAIANCRGFVGGDSSGVHLAGSMNKPAVGLYGSVDPKLRIAHYDSVTPIIGKADCVPCNDAQRHSCHGELHCPVCIWNIEPQHILNTMEEVLAKAR